MANYTFTYNQEIGHQGQSLVPHFPGGNSGVTIGPGYDMGHRSEQQIYSDLTNAGIDPETAYSLIDAAHKTGADAGSWLSQRGGIIITEQQQRSLFENVLVPQYEQRTQEQLHLFVRQHPELDSEQSLWENLSDKQKEILFDYVYNTGSLSRFPDLIQAVLTQDWDTATLHYERFSDEQPLAYRNEMFFREFLDPDSEPDSNPDQQNEAVHTTAEEYLAEDINELYNENRDENPLKDSDEWYENS